MNKAVFTTSDIHCHTEEDSKWFDKYPFEPAHMDYADRLEVYGFKTGKDF